MTEDQATAANADGADAPVDDVTVDSSSAIDASAKPADPAPEAIPADPDPAPTGDPAPKPKPARLDPWAEKLVADAKFAEREANRKLKELEEKLAAKDTPTAPATPTPADNAAAQANAPAGGYKSPDDFDKAVKAEADRRQAVERADTAQKAFDEKCNTAYSKGKETFKDDFDVAVGNLRTVGAMTPDMLDLVLETDDPAKVLYELGSDPDRAASIMSLSPAKRAFEIARLSGPAPKTPTQLSRAPAPVPLLDGTARVTAAPTDNDDDDTFFKKREAELKAQNRW